MNSDTLSGDTAQQLARSLIDRYFRTTSYPYTRHHLDSYDQFLQKDLISIIKSKNPIIILKDLLPNSETNYRYRVEIFVGGKDGTEIEIGSPTVSLQNTEEVRVLFPNEARLRNLTYMSTVYANILVKITYTDYEDGKPISRDISPPEDSFQTFPLFKIPIMLHSRYCILHGKNAEFLRQAGECPQDYGGYFVVDGAEKVLVTRQEQAFNTLYITEQKTDPKLSIYASITCLSPETRMTKRVAFGYTRKRPDKSEDIKKTGKGLPDDVILVNLPYVRKAVPLFVLFRALGFESDEEILRLIYPDFESAEAKLMLPKLQPSILHAFPILNTYTALQYIKTLTKGFGIEHVLDILRNQLFIHMPNDPTTQALFLADCVRKILRVQIGLDTSTDRDDTRNQRCLTSGFLVQMLFSHSYNLWIKTFSLAIAREYEANKKALYKGENFKNIFIPGNVNRVFASGFLSELIMRGFKGKWGTSLGEEKSGALQALSRLSYCDFISHCRRVILDFDTGMKLTGPRMLHTSQYGYFCTNETPSGASIGITKNLDVLTAISIASESADFYKWLRMKARVYPAEGLTEEQQYLFVPVFINSGLFGFVKNPKLLTATLKTLKRCGCLPYSVSISFSIRDRKVYIYLDQGRPLRPLIWLGEEPSDTKEPSREKLVGLKTWRDLVMGTLPARKSAGLDATDFFDPLADKPLEEYVSTLLPYTGAIEYIDPYEQNEIFVANYPEYIRPETTHMEVHPSTILSIMTSLIPFPHHNQSPRNQLSDSQSKQGVSMYATNWQNRFDNTAHVLCYGETPLCKTIYTSYLGEGKMPYGMNCVLAIACWQGYNQEDGIVMNYDAIQRGMFRTISYKSYEAFEEDDEDAHVKVRFGNPAKVPNWKEIKPGLDYSKLDDNGIIRVGEFCDENTVLVGAYMISEKSGAMSDASTTAQVWTRGRVEKIAVTVNNLGMRLVKVRVVQDRIPELGDKFSNRHGQKGTIGALLRGHDMPRSKDGIVPDMIMNPHAIPSRMTIAQNLEQLLGKMAANVGAHGDGTAFMNDGSPEGQIGAILETMGYEKYGNEVLYNGATGEQIPAIIFIGPVYGMRLKHMVEDKWQARGQGRREQRTHQPTGGRGNQGGLKIGEMDRDALLGHSMASFFRESFMERSDGAVIPICTSCGTIPIYNPRMNIAICPLCSGPVRFVGDRPDKLEILPPVQRPKGKIVNVEMPYATTVLQRELETYMNIGMRVITSADTQHLRPFELSAESTAVVKELPKLVLPSITVPEITRPEEEQTVTVEQLEAMGADVSALMQQFPPSMVVAADDNMPLLEGTGANPVIYPGGEEEEGEFEGSMMPMAQPLTQPAMMPLAQPMAQPAMMPMAQPLVQPAMMPLAQPLAQPQMGGAGSMILPSPVPNGPKMLVIDTSPMAMSGEGLAPIPTRGGFGRPRQLRQAPYFGTGGVPPQQGPAMIPGRSEGFGEERVTLRASAPVMVNKLG